ncbi:hypothetical protein E4U61_005810 [Claviceps capensis]|nr:hypothetical protein E4U61_005810 [Claviceps capensis]
MLITQAALDHGLESVQRRGKSLFNCYQRSVRRDVRIRKKAFDSTSLRPGGWIELQELLPITLCDDGIMPEDDPVKVLYETIGRALEKLGLKSKLAAELDP